MFGSVQVSTPFKESGKAQVPLSVKHMGFYSPFYLLVQLFCTLDSFTKNCKKETLASYVGKETNCVRVYPRNVYLSVEISS